MFPSCDAPPKPPTNLFLRLHGAAVEQHNAMAPAESHGGAAIQNASGNAGIRQLISGTKPPLEL